MQFLSTRKRRRAALAAAVAVVAIGGGIGYAFWSDAGDGAGTVATGTTAGFAVTGGATTGGPLTPGGAAASVAFTVHNSGTGNAALTNVTVTVANNDGSAWTAVTGCSAADYAVGAVTITYGTVAGGADLGGTVSITMTETGVNQDDCQNAAVPLYFVAS